MINCYLLKLYFVWNFRDKIVCRIQSNIFHCSKLRLCNVVQFSTSNEQFCYYLLKVFATKQSSNKIVNCNQYFAGFFVFIDRYFHKYHPYHLTTQLKVHNHYNALNLHFRVFLLIINILFLMDAQHINMSERRLIRLNYEFVFPDLEPLILLVFPMDDETCSHFKLCYFMFSFVTSSNLILFSSLFILF